MKKSKNYRKAEESFVKGKAYAIEEALEILEKFPKAKFDESVEIHIRTSIDPKKSDQQIRTSVQLPHGTGKKMKIAAFTSVQQKEAKEAGAEIIGGEELVKKISQSGAFNFNVAVATPEMMPKLGKIAKLLGPKGLMPNPKTQTIGPKIAEMIEALKKGRTSCKNDDSGNIHAVIGKRSFGKDKLLENFQAFTENLNRNKPATVKGKLVKRITLTATMVPGIKISS